MRAAALLTLAVRLGDILPLNAHTELIVQLRCEDVCALLVRLTSILSEQTKQREENGGGQKIAICERVRICWLFADVRCAVVVPCPPLTYSSPSCSWMLPFPTIPLHPRPANTRQADPQKEQQQRQRSPTEREHSDRQDTHETNKMSLRLGSPRSFRQCIRPGPACVPVAL